MKNKTMLFAAAMLLLCGTVDGQDKAPECRIPTRWAADVSQTSPHAEYPRPQMIRSDWQSLNGKWDYAITAQDVQKPESFDGKILVPFAPESSLSGVGRLLGKDSALWYSRTFTIPKTWAGKRVILNFDAVDWSAEVFINDILIGRHTGGFTAFSFDITPYLNAKGEQKLEVRVTDATDKAYQPRGKQVSNPASIWYTRVSGIWQSVWMEPVSNGNIDSYYVTSDVDKNQICISTTIAKGVEGDVVLAELLEGSAGYSTENPSNKVIASSKVASGTDIKFTVNDLQKWTPDVPYIYGLRLSLIREGKVIDKVDGYAIARSIGIVSDGLSHKRMAINGEPLFQMGPLDQGWWPDGLYTAATDEALEFDVQKTKDLGFNMIRKHIKVEPARWYWYCDRIGIVVWQDMPSITAGGNRWGTEGFLRGTDRIVPQEWKDNYYKEWAEIIDQRKFFQSIVVWVPFNEAWGQFDTEKTAEFTKALDPSRLVNAASGGNYHYCGDILDIHHYPAPAMPFHDGNYVMVLGEYGGIGLPLEGHLWNPDMKNWGYVQYKNAKEVTDTYEEYAEILKSFIPKGYSAAVYTQTTDVEGEVNGFMTYDREVVKMDEARVKAINEGIIKAMK